MSAPIETYKLGKNYGDVQAVKELSLRVEQGEIYGFLGLNGAGKTTTIRMLLGMVRPNSGYASVLGRRVRPGRREPWAQVGYMVEAPRAYPELTVAENLEVARRLHPGTLRAAIGGIVERLSLGSYAERRAGTLSQGNAQRLGLAKALLHAPRLLLLDEPANGLDPAGIVEVRELLLELTRQQGVTVFMSSHILAEVSRLADRIGVIHEGRLLQELNADELERKRRRRLLVRSHHMAKARQALVGAGHHVALLAENLLAVDDQPAIQHPDEVARLLVGTGAAPTQLVVEEEDLEAYFLRLVGVNGRLRHEPQ
jgi:ABC-2 type transport system ATP-binding protein